MTRAPTQDGQSQGQCGRRGTGVFRKSMYQTRHTYASMMLTAGEHPAWLAMQMGHKDWTMIARVYAKWIKDAHPDAGSKAVALFGGNGV